jgi:hypothetical protein
MPNHAPDTPIRGLLRLLVPLVTLAIPAFASAQAPYFHHELIETPRSQVPSICRARRRPANGREQWFLQNGNIGVRNVVQPTLTPVLPVGSSRVRL